MSYIEFINQLIRNKVSEANKMVIYGQNVSTGSCVSGLARGIRSEGNCTVINTTNAENTLAGVGFGLMLRGVSSIFIMKQQDFLLLGIDQLVNTYNILRRMNLNASFTILPIIVDSGYEGPQSCLNNFSDFCSIAHIPGYSITNRHDAEGVINAHLIAPGFRIIGVSQRLFRNELIECDGPVTSDKNGEIFQYADGQDATVVSFNLAFPQALGVWRTMKERKINASLFSVNAMLPKNWNVLLADVRRSQRLIVLDDSKSENRSSDRFLLEAREVCSSKKTVMIHREYSDEWFIPNPDQLMVEPSEVIERLTKDVEG